MFRVMTIAALVFAAQQGMAQGNACGQGYCSVGQEGNGRHAGTRGVATVSGHSSGNGEAGLYDFRTSGYFEAGANSIGNNDAQAGVIKEDGVIISAGNRNN